MPVEVGLWRVDGETPVRMRSSGIPLEAQLESFIEQDPAILGDPLLIIGRQVPTGTGGFIDLVAIDAEGNLHVLELKRDRTPRDVVAQTLDYASWVSGLTHTDVRELYETHRPDIPFDVAFSEAFQTAPPEDLNSSHRLTIVAHDADAATERIVTYLSSYGVPINVLFFRHFEDDGRRYLARTWLVSENTVAGRAGTRRQSTKEPWNGQDWYVSFGEFPDQRNWDDARRYGFVSAGGGLWFSRTLRGLPVGARIFVYIPQTGYVGVAEVTREAVPFDDAIVHVNGAERRLADLELKGAYHHPASEDEDPIEYVVAVRWIRTLDREAAIRAPGLFSNQHSACRLRSSFTIETLTRKFGLDE